MDILAAIDLRAGRCVRLHQGDFSKETVYDDDPLARAKAFEAAGAPWIHVVDLDAARGQGSNRGIVVDIAAAVSIPVQAGGGVRDASLLDDGVARIVLGSLAVADPARTATLLATHPGRIAVGLDHRRGEVRVRGWEEGAAVEVLDAISGRRFAGAAAFVVTDIDRDGTLTGPDLDGLGAVLAATTVPVIASGGVGTLADVAALLTLGVSGVIVGRALYEGRFSLEEAVACSRSG